MSEVIENIKMKSLPPVGVSAFYYNSNPLALRARFVYTVWHGLHLLNIILPYQIALIERVRSTSGVVDT